MDNNTDEIIMGAVYGYCDFENYWGEELTKVDLVHYVSGIVNTTKIFMTSKTLQNVPDKASLKKEFTIQFQRNSVESYDYWEVTIHTKSGKIYRTKDRFYCSIAFYDSENVILGVNGDAKTLYVAFSSSSGCSTKLLEVV